MGRTERIAQLQALWTSVTWEEVKTFIGPNADGYKAAWERNAAGIAKQGYPGFSWSWSWPAFIPILGIPWAAARKQWMFIGIMVGVIVVANIAVALLPGASFGFMAFLVPMMAKNFYVQTTVTKIAKIKETITDEDARTLAIRAAGGLNMLWGYIAGAICTALIIVSVAALVLSEA
jgi:hypothetical protein